MTTVTPVQPTTIPCAALTKDDIARMPKSFNPVQNEEDVFEQKQPKESHILRNTIIGLVIAAAAIVGLRHCDFISKFDPSDMNFTDKWIRRPIKALGSWIEWPFTKVYKMIKGDK